MGAAEAIGSVSNVRKEKFQGMGKGEN